MPWWRPLTVRCDVASGRVERVTLQTSTKHQHQDIITTPTESDYPSGSSGNSQRVHWSPSKHFTPNSNCTNSSLSSAPSHLYYPPQPHASPAPFNSCALLSLPSSHALTREFYLCLRWLHAHLTVLILHLPPMEHPFHNHHRLNMTPTQACILMMIRPLCGRFFRLTSSRPHLLGSISTVIGKVCRRGRWCSWERVLRNRKFKIPDEWNMWAFPSAVVAFALCLVLCLSYLITLTYACSICSSPSGFLPLCLTSSMTHMQQICDNLMYKLFDFDFDFSTKFFYSSVSSTILRGGWLIQMLIHTFLFVVSNSGCSCFHIWRLQSYLTSSIHAQYLDSIFRRKMKTRGRRKQRCIRWQN